MPELALVTNVKHYLHQVEAAQQAGYDVGLRGPWYPSAPLHAVLTGLGGPVGQLAGRRGPRPPGLTSAGGLGPGQLIPPLLGRANLAYPPPLVRLVHVLERTSSQRGLERADLIHAVEGLAPTRRRLSTKPLLLERRNLHHEVFEAVIPPVGGMPGTPQQPDSLRDVLEREYRQADVIQVYSESARTSFLERGYAAEKLSVVPIPFRPANQGVPRSGEGPATALYVGRCVVEKGIDVAVEAVRRSARVERLVVAGAATPEVQAWLHSCPHVDYRGIQPRSEVVRLMAQCSVFLMPSIESYGLAVLEAVDVGAPVLIARTTGVSEFLTREDPDAVLEGRDPDRWADAIDRLAAAGERDLNRRVARQRAVFGHISWASVVRCQADVYARFAGAARSADSGTA